MPLPPELTQITITGQFLKGDGDAETGTITFTSQEILQSSGLNLFIGPITKTVTLDANGAFTTSLSATTDPDFIPQNFAYTVKVDLSTISKAWTLVVPYDAIGGTIDLADVLANSDNGNPTSYVHLTSVGQIGGPAGPLDGTGKIPVAQIPTSIVAGVSSVNTRTGDVVLDKSDVGLASVDNTSDLNKPVSNATATALAGKTDLSTLTTKGDLYVASASATVGRLGVGTDGQVLTADSTQALGMRWTTVSGGGGSGAVLLDPTTPATNTITPDAANSWLDGIIATSAGDTNVDQLRLGTTVPAGGSGSQVWTFRLNGNFETRFAPSTPGRVAARVFEFWESHGLGASTGNVFEVSTNPTITANRKALLAVRGTAHSTQPGWVVVSERISAPNIDDSDWYALTLVNSSTWNTTYEEPSIRLENGGRRIAFKGRVEIVASLANGTAFAQIPGTPTGMIPSKKRGFSVRTGGTNLATIMEIDTSGNMSFIITMGGSPGWLYLDDMSFAI